MFFGCHSIPTFLGISVDRKQNLAFWGVTFKFDSFLILRFIYRKKFERRLPISDLNLKIGGVRRVNENEKLQLPAGLGVGSSPPPQPLSIPPGQEATNDG